MKNIVIKFAGDGILIKAWLIKEEQNWEQADKLSFNKQGLATISVKENAEYILSWTLFGTPGASWNLEIEDPSAYQWKYYCANTWYSTKISIEKSLSGACYSELRIIRIK